MDLLTSVASHSGPTMLSLFDISSPRDPVKQTPHQREGSREQQAGSNKHTVFAISFKDRAQLVATPRNTRYHQNRNATSPIKTRGWNSSKRDTRPHLSLLRAQTHCYIPKCCLPTEGVGLSRQRGPPGKPPYLKDILTPSFKISRAFIICIRFYTVFSSPNK